MYPWMDLDLDLEWCRDGWVKGLMDDWLGGLLYQWADDWIAGWVDGCMNGSVIEWMDMWRRFEVWMDLDCVWMDVW